MGADERGRRKELAIASLLASGTLAEAAARCRVAQSTLRRCLENREFTRSLLELLLRAAKLQDVEERISALEQVMRERLRAA
jgi:hypothetical protein